MHKIDVLEDFGGPDPVLGELALRHLSGMGLEGLGLVLDSGNVHYLTAWHSTDRLVRLVKHVGSPAVSLLLRDLKRGDWWAGLRAAECFAAFKRNKSVAVEVRKLLCSDEIDLVRMAIKALGNLEDNDSTHAIRCVAMSGDPGRFIDSASSDGYYLEKYGSYACGALLRIYFGNSAFSSDCMHGVKAIISECERIRPSFAGNLYCEIKSTLELANPAQIDVIYEKFSNANNPRLLESVIEAIGVLSIQRYARSFVEMAGDESKPESLRSVAASALASMASPQTAGLLARTGDRLATTYRWPFVMSYAYPAEWPDCSDLVAEILGTRGQDAPLLLHALAHRRENGFLEQMLAGLDMSGGLSRGISALALARAHPDIASRVLPLRIPEAAGDDERAMMSAALIIAQGGGNVDGLHQALTKWSSFHRLLRPFTADLFLAFFLAEGVTSTRGIAWAKVASLDWDKFCAEIKMPAKPAIPDATPLLPANVTVPVAAPAAGRIFVSYSHDDVLWLDQIKKRLAPVARSGVLEIWDDHRIDAGAKWRDEIEQAMAGCSVAFFLVSTSFLASDFVMREELPTLLTYAKGRGCKVLWVVIDHCLYESCELANYQALCDPQKPLSDLPDKDQGRELTEICRKIVKLASAANA